MTVVRKLRGLLFCCFFVTSSFLSFIFLLCPGAILFLLLRKINLYQKWNTFWLASFMTLLTAVVELLGGTKVYFHGDYIDPTERFLMINNHRTELDWAYSWMFFIRFGNLQWFKLVLKDALRQVPVWGYVCQSCGYLFVKRNWQEDQALMARQCVHLRHSGTPLQILLYPEGADFEGRGKPKSDAYALANRLPIYKHLLHPRTSGFSYLVSHLGSHLDCVVDATVAYPKNIVYSVKDLFLGHFPEEVHFHLHRYPVMSLPENSKELGIWLKELWERKETRLDQFYRTSSFELAEDAPRPDARHLHDTCDIQTVNAVAHHRLFCFGVFWLLFTFATLYAICTVWYVRWYVVLMSLANVLIEHHLGGLLHLELRLSEGAAGT